MLLHIFLHFCIGIGYSVREPHNVIRILESIIEGQCEILVCPLAMPIILLQESIVMHVMCEFRRFYLLALNVILKVLDILAASLPSILVLQRTLVWLQFVWIFLLKFFQGEDYGFHPDLE